MSLQILSHSFRMIANNIPDVIRIALIPWVGTIALIYASTYLQFGEFLQLIDPSPYAIDVTDETTSSGVGFLISIVFLIAVCCVYLWVIVGWHRFILLGEGPNQFAPNWHGDRNLAYFLSSLMITLALFIPIVILAWLMSVVGLRGGFISFWIMGFLFNLFVIFIGTRISLILPAAAIGVPMKIGQSWEATAKHNGMIFTLALMLSVISVAVGVVVSALAFNVVGVFLGQFLNAIFGLYSVSVITTLYGVLIEGREI